MVVRTRLDGSLAVIYDGKPLEYCILPVEALQTPRKVQTLPAGKAVQAGQPKRRNQSPWRQGSIMMTADTGKKVACAKGEKRRPTKGS